MCSSFLLLCYTYFYAGRSDIYLAGNNQYHVYVIHISKDISKIIDYLKGVSTGCVTIYFCCVGGGGKEIAFLHRGIEIEKTPCSMVKYSE